MKEQAALDSPLHTSRRFTLRTLFILVSLIGVGCAIVAWLLQEPTYPVVLIASPVVSPSGKQIAFVVVRTDETDDDGPINVRLAVVSLSDGQTTNTAAELDMVQTPMTWARDESHIMFVSGHSDNFWGLDSIDLATRNVKSIASPEIRMPQYSPNGTYLGYVRGNDLIIENMRTGQRTHVQSGVSHYYWCWSPNNSDVFYIRDGLIVCQYDLLTNSERILFTASSGDEYPAHLVSSPDGSQLGYHFDDWFHIVDLQSGNTSKQFKCNHYFLDFDWSVAGICYVDAVDGVRRSKANVMVFDPTSSKSSLVTTGSFSHPRWLDNSMILVQKGKTELWSYSVVGGKSVKLNGPTDEGQ